MDDSLIQRSNPGVRIIRFGDGKLNPLGARTRTFIHENLEKVVNDGSIKAVVLAGKGNNFSAGADLTEFGVPNEALTLTDLVEYMDTFEKPLVAAIDGVALGGGLEIALACHYRILSARGKVGLPEVRVGVIPGAGGTQRLPRLIGVQKAIDYITTGRQIKAPQALELKIADAISNSIESLIETAVTWAKWATLMPIQRVIDVNMNEEEVKAICSAAMKKLPPKELGGEGVRAAVTAIASCAKQPDGQEVEVELFWETLSSSQGAARRHGFFATRAAQKSNLKVPVHHPLLSKSKSVVVGVVGGGLMGSGIAMVLLQAGFCVRLVDIYDAALQKGVAFINKTIESNLKKGRITEDKAALLKSNLRPSTSLESLSDALLVVEAVVENMSVKKKIFSQLNMIVKSKTAILLSNTSTLSIDEMASEALNSSRRPYFAGWHFFSPAHIMQLVEVIYGNETSDETTALLQALTKKVGKVGVLSGNCDGFIGNRMLKSYSSEPVMLLAEGVATVQSVDRAVRDVHGMVLGIFEMSDLAGNDIGYFIRKARGLVRDPKTGVVGPNRGSMRYTELGDDMITELGRLGQKTMKGWYDYDPKVGKGRKGLPSKEMEEFIARYTPHMPQPQLSDTEIVERLFFPLVNEAFKILEEGIASKPSDIDVVYLYGYGWPSWRGGPMYWADNDVGLPHLLDRLNEFYSRHPNSPYFQPSKLLEKCVHLDMKVQDYYAKGMHKSPSSKL